MKYPLHSSRWLLLLMTGAGLLLGQANRPAPTPPAAAPAPSGGAPGGSAASGAKDPTPVERPSTPATQPATTRQTAAAVPTIPPPAVPRIETFRIIYERNMFNAHRIGLAPRTAREGRDVSGDMVTLVGTLIDQKRAVAFFDSADPRYRRVLKEGARLPSGHTLKKVEPDGITISRDNATARVQVTQRLHRMDNGDWEILQPESGVALASGASAVVDPTKPAAASAMPVIPPNASDALRRLMEQRQKQLKE